MGRIATLLVAASALGALAGCGSGGDGGSADRAVVTSPAGSSDDGGTPAPVDPIHDTPFCAAARGLEALGREPAPADRSATQVLAQNERLAELVEILAANTPEDAPADLGALVADYRILTKAILDARGDVEAAFAVLDAGDPQLSIRLGLPDSYHEAVVYFAERCGTARPGGQP